MVASSVSVLLVATFVVFGGPTFAVNAAIAAGIPPAELNEECVLDADTGGWDQRDITSNGTRGTSETVPIRPLVARVSEPCVITDGPDAGEIGLTWQGITPPNDIVDENEDGEDDDPPSANAECNSTIAETDPPTPYEIGLISEQCSKVMTFYNTGGTAPHPPVYAPGVWGVGTVTLDGTYEADVTFDIGWNNNGTTDIDSTMTFRIGYYCKDYLGNIGEDPDMYTNHEFIRGSAPESIHLTCSQPTDTVWAIIASTRNISGQRTYGHLYLSGEEPAGGFDGDGYHGGTQSGSLYWGNLFTAGKYPENSTVICSNNYGGTPEEVYTINDFLVVYSNGFTEWDSTTFENGLGLQADDCEWLISINIVVCQLIGYNSVGAEVELNCFMIHWTAENFVLENPYDGNTPEETLCIEYPDDPSCFEILHPGGTNGPIVCDFDINGDVILAPILFAIQLPAWVKCMFTPLGWDRDERLARLWETGYVGGGINAFQDAMPNTLACGEVAVIPFMDTTLTINSCDADFAPAWVKVAIGWIIVLGLGALSIRRIMWSIGGDSK